MLTIYENRSGALERQKGKPQDHRRSALDRSPQSHAEDEEKKVERALKFNVPTREEQQEIEASSRLYQENGAYFMTATLLYQTDQGEPRTTPVTFILAGQRLVTRALCRAARLLRSSSRDAIAPRPSSRAAPPS